MTTKDKSWPVVPTSWIEKTPEGLPPPSVLLLLLSASYDSDDNPIWMVDQGLYSEKLGVFLTLEGIAIEQSSELVAYSIIHGLDGVPIEL